MLDLPRDQQNSRPVYVLRFECCGKSEKSKGYYLGVDSFAAVVPVYERPPGFDLRKIQK
jgi:hypothetical protein